MFNTYMQESAQVIQSSTFINEYIAKIIDTIVSALKNNKPLLVCGNGGSAADAMHIVGELVGRFKLERAGLNVICLNDNPVVMTAWGNDYSFGTIFARQVQAYGTAGGVLLGISTSGNSCNVLAAFELAHKMQMTTIALTGKGGGKLAELSDYLLAVPSKDTPLIQQAHVCIYHYLCMEIEKAMV